MFEAFVSVESSFCEDPKLQDDAVISALAAWRNVPTLKLLKINGLTGESWSWESRRLEDGNGMQWQDMPTKET